jgi:hypothetical protein
MGQLRRFYDVGFRSAYALEAVQERTFNHLAFGPQSDSRVHSGSPALRRPSSIWASPSDERYGSSFVHSAK